MRKTTDSLFLFFSIGTFRQVDTIEWIPSRRNERTEKRRPRRSRWDFENRPRHVRVARGKKKVAAFETLRLPLSPRRRRKCSIVKRRGYQKQSPLALSPWLFNAINLRFASNSSQSGRGSRQIFSDIRQHNADNKFEGRDENVPKDALYFISFRPSHL